MEKATLNDVNAVLQQFEEVFKASEGLTPTRIWPCYSFKGRGFNSQSQTIQVSHQKPEVEKRNKIDLELAHIQAKLFWLKKDGGWRFVWIIGILNKITGPNKFPIPVLEELLDVLEGAKVSSKLDLKLVYHQIR